MIDIDKLSKDTEEIRSRIWRLWDAVERGTAKGRQPKTEIAAANVILSSHKVDIAAAHYAGIPPTVRPTKQVNGRSRRIAS